MEKVNRTIDRARRARSGTGLGLVGTGRWANRGSKYYGLVVIWHFKGGCEGLIEKVNRGTDRARRARSGTGLGLVGTGRWANRGSKYYSFGGFMAFFSSILHFLGRRGGLGGVMS